MNALLDDSSTKMYINSDIAAELGLQDRVQNLTVNMLNVEVKTLKTMPVECELVSLKSQTKTRIVAFTADKVTGDMQPIDWEKHSKNT